MAHAAVVLGINLLVGPVGWVVLIGSLAATAYVAYQTSEWADKEAKARVGNIYDNVTRRF
ncbi:hypothetical protein [Vibrio cincinnatiensis]|uniref:hypothetical protein n=1 Tax=Vibrio cincinnatiensis TaxID=675 RepID=UPI0012ACD5E4|nr:hypothetical protein [Vibrio cincinnatiensis]